MKQLITWALLTALVPTVRPDQTRRGAKDLFYDASSTAVVYVPASGRTKPAQTEARQAIPQTFGIHYRIELFKDDGELMPVPASRPFRTNERIRLHITSNVTGRLTIWQQVNGGVPQPLFPGRSTPDEESLVRAHAPLAIPSRGFRFDDRPGLITLLVRVDPSPQLLPASSAEGQPSHSVMPEPPSMDETRTLARNGSKGLVLEEDGAEAYCSQTIQQDEPVKALIATIKLQHLR